MNIFLDLGFCLSVVVLEILRREPPLHLLLYRVDWIRNVFESAQR